VVLAVIELVCVLVSLLDGVCEPVNDVEVDGVYEPLEDTEPDADVVALRDALGVIVLLILSLLDADVVAEMEREAECVAG
jgi:hypothetical protein